MQIVKIKPELISKFSKDTEMLQKESRPCVLVVNLKYKGKSYDFAIPIRSNIPAASPKDEYFPLPTRNSTKDHNRHGIHIIKMFPVSKDYYDRYRTDNIYSALIKAIINRNSSEIVASCQNYLDHYSAGIRSKYATDIDLLISLLQSGP